MLILLPPSEGKVVPRRGRPLDLDALAHSDLTRTRRVVLDALVRLCREDGETAWRVLGLGPTQADAVLRDARLPTAPTARADRVYAGVLYEALDAASLSPSARRRATRSVLVTSGLFGVVRLDDRIPAYRLSGDVVLPGLGPIGSVWRPPLGQLMPGLVGSGLLLDLRSQAYVSFFRPPAPMRPQAVSLRVLHEHRGSLKVVSHFNKATKGRLVRSLLESGDAPRSVTGLVDRLHDLGWRVRRDGQRLDVVVDEV